MRLNYVGVSCMKLALVVKAAVNLRYSANSFSLCRLASGTRTLSIAQWRVFLLLTSLGSAQTT